MNCYSDTSYMNQTDFDIHPLKHKFLSKLLSNSFALINRNCLLFRRTCSPQTLRSVTTSVSASSPAPSSFSPARPSRRRNTTKTTKTRRERKRRMALTRRTTPTSTPPRSREDKTRKSASSNRVDYERILELSRRRAKSSCDMSGTIWPWSPLPPQN
jgi:hypothetical protein